jgi:hypothetical protein
MEGSVSDNVASSDLAPISHHPRRYVLHKCVNCSVGDYSVYTVYSVEYEPLVN